MPEQLTCSCCDKPAHLLIKVEDTRTSEVIWLWASCGCEATLLIPLAHVQHQAASRQRASRERDRCIMFGPSAKPVEDVG